MTISRINTGSSVKKTCKHSSQVSCHGEYCSLIHSLERNQLLDDNKSETHGRIKSDGAGSRNRAFSVIKCLFTKDELGILEASGKLIHLKIPHEISQDEERAVPKETIQMSKMEHRLAIMKLAQAEEVSSNTDNSLYCGSCDGRERQGSFVDQNVSTKYNDVPVCEMCYYVYRLLSHARCLMSDNYTSTKLGKAELDAFFLNDLKRQSSHPVTPQSTKRNIQERLSLKPQLVQPSSVLQTEFKGRDECHQANIKDFVGPSSPLSRCNNARKKRKMKRIEPQVAVKVNEKCLDNSIVSSCKSRYSAEVIKTKLSCSVCQVDEKTSFPYTVLGEKSTLSREKLYNLVVCHDLFDTYERMEIFLSSFIEQYPQHQILLWNYPGQAYTTFAPTQILNNEFHAKCLNYLLKQVGPEGTNEFDVSSPFYIFGHGNGGTIACTYASNNAYIPGLKGICLLNPLTFLDTHYASVIHDCRNVFSCSPETRPDLPLYFYSRFIFSQEYLQKVSTPLALNLYTAVNNPISIHGRVSLCSGVLKNTDIRKALSEIRSPIISIHGNHSELVRPLHASTFLEGRNRCSTIHEALDQKGKRKTLIIAMDGGYELLQEKKKLILGFLEELLIGYYEGNSSSTRRQLSMNVVDTLSHKWIGILEKKSSKGKDLQSNHREGVTQNINLQSIAADERIESQRPSRNEDAEVDIRKSYSRDNHQKAKKTKVHVILDPCNPSFERQQNSVYKAGKGSIYPPSNEISKPKEYMSWRLQRNRKRLSRFQKAARIIQGSLRVYMAKTMTSRLKIQRSAINIQRCFRGMLGRRIFQQLRKELWAAQLVQRAYRGSVGRKTSYYRRISIQAQINIARVWRGHVDRKLVKRILTHRNVAAINLQSLWRRCMAIDMAQKLRKIKYGATTIQRIFRGYRGRIKANMERDKYIFSKSQSIGIELGRQMLADHKLHATRLQSELSILEKERESLDSKVDVISNELSNFQNQAKELEKTMHQISMVEAQKRSDIAAQQALRQKKA